MPRLRGIARGPWAEHQGKQFSTSLVKAYADRIAQFAAADLATPA
jgi:hypothetical protein